MTKASPLSLPMAIILVAAKPAFSPVLQNTHRGEVYGSSFLSGSYDHLWLETPLIACRTRLAPSAHAHFHVNRSDLDLTT